MSPRSALLPAAAVVLVALFHLLAWGSYAEFSASVDFNRGALEDFMGPYFTTARGVLAGEGSADGFLYSPLFALLLVPLGALEPGPASWAWLVVELCATVALIALPLLIVRPRTARGLAAYLLAAGLSFPLVHNLHWGQVSVPLTALILAALVALERGGRGAARVLLALAAAIKFYPAFVLAHFALREEWAEVAWTLLFIALFGLGVPALVLGPAEAWAFYETVAARLRAAHGTGWADSTNMQHAPAVLARVLGVESAGGFAALRVASYACALGALALARRAANGGREDATATSFALVLCALPFVLSPCWPHYFAWLPFAQLCIARRGGPLARGLVGLSAILASAPFFRWSGTPEDYGRAGWLLAANALVLLAAIARPRPCAGRAGGRA